jgi:hypothetical protein
VGGRGGGEEREREKDGEEERLRERERGRMRERERERERERGTGRGGEGAVEGEVCIRFTIQRRHGSLAPAAARCLGRDMKLPCASMDAPCDLAWSAVAFFSCGYVFSYTLRLP